MSNRIDELLQLLLHPIDDQRMPCECKNCQSIRELASLVKFDARKDAIEECEKRCMEMYEQMGNVNSTGLIATKLAYRACATQIHNMLSREIALGDAEGERSKG